MESIEMSRRALKRGLIAVGTAVALTAVTGCAGGTSADTEPPADHFRVAVLTVGTETDGAFGNAWSNAVKLAVEETGADIDWVGNLYNPNEYISQGASYATAGYDLVLLAHGGMLPAGEQLAAEFPDTQFCVAPIPTVDEATLPDNLCVVDVRQEIGAFRAGALAGLVTTTDTVASNQALPIPAITRQATAYALGAKCVNADITVLNEITNNDSDPSITKTASETQIREGADVLFGATGTAMNGMFEAAKQADGVFAIGQYVDSSAVAPSVVLATTILNVEEVLSAMVQDAQSGELTSFRAYGLDGAVDVGFLVTNDELFDTLPAGVRQRFNEVQDAITSGEIQIPDTTQLIDEAAAAEIDVRDLGCSPE